MHFTLASTGTLDSKLAQGGLLALQLSASSNESVLMADMTIKTGSVVFLNGAGRTIKMADRQFVVEKGGRLCMYNLNLIDGQVCPFSQAIGLSSQCCQACSLRLPLT